MVVRNRHPLLLLSARDHSFCIGVLVGNHALLRLLGIDGSTSNGVEIGDWRRRRGSCMLAGGRGWERKPALCRCVRSTGRLLVLLVRGRKACDVLRLLTELTGIRDTIGDLRGGQHLHHVLGCASAVVFEVTLKGGDEPFRELVRDELTPVRNVAALHLGVEAVERALNEGNAEQDRLHRQWKRDEKKMPPTGA